MEVSFQGNTQSRTSRTDSDSFEEVLIGITAGSVMFSLVDQSEFVPTGGTRSSLISPIPDYHLSLRTRKCRFRRFRPGPVRLALMLSVLSLCLLDCAGYQARHAPSFDSSIEFTVVRIIDNAFLAGIADDGKTASPSGRAILAEPISVCADGSGTLLVLDRGTEQLVRIPVGDERDRPVSAFATAHVLLIRPGVVRLDVIGNAYVCEVEEGQIGVFDGRLRLVDWLSAPPYEALGLVPGRLVGIAFGPMGDMYLSDEVNGRVYHYDAAGRFLSPIGSEDDPWSQLTQPAGLASASADGSLYVCDPGQGRLVVFDDGGVPRYIVGANDLAKPQAVAVDRWGHCYVVDSERRALFVFSREGDLLRRIEGDQLVPGGLAGPTDIVLVDSTLWIADPPAGRVLEVRLRRPDR